jgi:hypothetical protein
MSRTGSKPNNVSPAEPLTRKTMLTARMNAAPVRLAATPAAAMRTVLEAANGTLSLLIGSCGDRSSR